MHQTNLSAVCNILVPSPGIQVMPPAVKVWSLNHWTAKEVLKQQIIVRILF